MTTRTDIAEEDTMGKTKTYVCTESGRYLVQVPDDSQWGFALCDDDQSWPGGFGIASEWTAIGADQVPAEVRAELDWLLD